MVTGSVANGKEVVKRYKLPLIRLISTGDVIYNMTIFNTAIYYESCQESKS